MSYPAWAVATKDDLPDNFSLVLDFGEQGAYISKVSLRTGFLAYPFKRRTVLISTDTDGESDDEDFSWMDKIDPKLMDSETYFCFINESRYVMRKGEQAWNCYG